MSEHQVMCSVSSTLQFCTSKEFFQAGRVTKDRKVESTASKLHGSI